MKSPLCDLLGIEFPLFAFSHCRDVVAAVSSAGGFGVLGASSHTPEQLEHELKWIDGQGIGMLHSIKSTRAVVRDFMEEFAEAALHLGELVAE